MIGYKEKWKDIPFSYEKACMALTMWIEAAAFIIVFFWPGIKLSSGAGYFLALLAWGVFGIGLYELLLRVVWYTVSREFRANIAYNKEEALAGKGTIKSYADLIRWLRLRNPSCS